MNHPYPTTRVQPDHDAIEAVYAKTRASVLAYRAEQHGEATYAQKIAASEKQIRYRRRKKEAR